MSCLCLTSVPSSGFIVNVFSFPSFPSFWISSSARTMIHSIQIQIQNVHLASILYETSLYWNAWSKTWSQQSVGHIHILDNFFFVSRLGVDIGFLFSKFLYSGFGHTCTCLKHLLCSNTHSAEKAGACKLQWIFPLFETIQGSLENCLKCNLKRRSTYLWAIGHRQHL